MKLEYIPETNTGKVLLLYGNEPNIAKEVMKAFYDLAEENVESISIHEIPGIETVENCKLTVKGGSYNQGIQQISENNFECILKPVWLDNIAGLIEPFTKETSGFQYLDENGKVMLIISTERSW
jgi:hypothetical protein